MCTKKEPRTKLCTQGVPFSLVHNLILDPKTTDQLFSTILKIRLVLLYIYKNSIFLLYYVIETTYIIVLL